MTLIIVKFLHKIGAIGEYVGCDVFLHKLPFSIKKSEYFVSQFHAPARFYPKPL